MRNTRVQQTSPVRVTARWLARHPRSVTAATVAGITDAYVGYQVMLIAAGAMVLAGVGWCLLDKPTFDRFAGRLLRAWWRRWAVYQRQWQRITFGCGLTQVDHNGNTVLPRVLGVRSTYCWDTVKIRMAKAQTAADYEQVVDRLADAYRSRRATVRQLKPGTIALDFQRREPFDDLFIPLPPMPSSVEQVDLSHLVIGRDEYGRDFALDLLGGLHMLFAGATGAGKGSWVWGLLRAMAPLIRAGLVRLWVIDPKGGMELGLGAEMFHRFATSDDQGLALTDEYVRVMDRRKDDLGKQGVRSVPVSAETPMEILICDELAAMTEYASREVSREFEPLLSKALTQYRALNGRVVGAVQEPTKDNIPMRGLFPTKAALRLDESSYVDMCLGEGVRDRGALADQIPDYMPGVGYVKRDGRREPLRVRAAYVSDADIAELVAFCTSRIESETTATVTPIRPENRWTDDDHDTDDTERDQEISDADIVEEITYLEGDDDGEDIA